MDTNADSVMGQAAGLNWSANHLQDVLNREVKMPNPDQIALVGCFFSVVLLRSFAVELALKSVYMKESGRQPEYSHSLHQLFGRLELETQRAIDRVFQGVRGAFPEQGGRTNSVAEILAKHKDDFVDWRYASFGLGRALNTEVLDLAPVVPAIVAYYQAHLSGE